MRSKKELKDCPSSSLIFFHICGHSFTCPPSTLLTPPFHQPTVTLKPTGGFFTSLFVDVGAQAIANDTEYLAHRSLWVAHVRSDVAKAVVRSVVLAFCEEKQFRVAFETKSDCELEHASEPRDFLLRFGHTAVHGDHVVLGDFTHVAAVTGAAATAANAPAIAGSVLDDKTHAVVAGADNPLRSYFTMFFDELAQKLVRSCLLRSYDSVPLPPSVLDLHAARQERLKRDAASALGRRSLPGIRWSPPDRDWRASLRAADSPARAKATRDEAVRLFADFVVEQKFVITQFQPSIVCELPPNDTVEQCTVRMRAATSKANAGLILITYEMTPAKFEQTFFLRFFDVYTKLLERNDLLQLSRMVERRRALRSLAAATSEAKTAADIAADRKDASDDSGSDSGAAARARADAPSTAPAPEFTTRGVGVVYDGCVTTLPDPKKNPSEFQAVLQRAQLEAKARVTPAAVKPSTSTLPRPSPTREPEQPRRANGVIVEVLEAFEANDRGEESLADVSTDEDDPPPPPPADAPRPATQAPRPVGSSMRKAKPPPPSVPPPPPVDEEAPVVATAAAAAVATVANESKD